MSDVQTEAVLVSVKMPRHIVVALDDQAKRQCMTRSEAIRYVIREWLTYICTSSNHQDPPCA